MSVRRFTVMRPAPTFSRELRPKLSVTLLTALLTLLFLSTSPASWVRAQEESPLQLPAQSPTQPPTVASDVDAAPGVDDRVALVVNGVGVDGATTSLVPGTTYAPAATFAGALGAAWRFDADAGLLSLEFGAHLLSLQSFSTPAAGADAQGSLTVDGRALPGPGGVIVEGRPYLPVKSVAAALGGYTTQLTTQFPAGALEGASGVVAVVFPRPSLTRLAPPGVWGRAERFVLEFSAPVTVEPFFEPSLRVVRFRFLRAALGDSPGGEGSGAPLQRFSGSHFSDAALVPDVGHLDFNVTLRTGNDYSVFSEPMGAGQRVIIDLFAAGARAGTLTGAAAPPLILDPSEGTQVLARELQRALAARGVDAQLSWGEASPDPAVRMRAGIGAPLFVSLSRAPLGPEHFNLYYLAAEADGGFGEVAGEVPLRSPPPEGLAPLSGAGRARITPLLSDFELGGWAARRLQEELLASGLRLGELFGMPLFVLSGAAGRGVMLELSTEVPTTPELVAALADSLTEVFAEVLAALGDEATRAGLEAPR